jgi:hypothetical protein
VATYKQDYKAIEAQLRNALSKIELSTEYLESLMTEPPNNTNIQDKVRTRLYWNYAN